jgi:hypothetical protein
MEVFGHRSWRLGKGALAEPGPPWEEIALSFHAEPGGYALLDRVRVATQCVPEPTGALLLICGLGGLLALRARRRRAA